MKHGIARTKEMTEKYRIYRSEQAADYSESFSFDLSKENILHEGTHWAVIPNDFPYDQVFDVHHLLIPKRVFAFASDMTTEEFDELQQLKIDLDKYYDSVMENLYEGRSVHKHFHLQLCVWKRVDD